MYRILLLLIVFIPFVVPSAYAAGPQEVKIYEDEITKIEFTQEVIPYKNDIPTGVLYLFTIQNHKVPDINLTVIPKEGSLDDCLLKTKNSYITNLNAQIRTCKNLQVNNHQAFWLTAVVIYPNNDKRIYSMLVIDGANLRYFLFSGPKESQYETIFAEFSYIIQNIEMKK